MNLAIRSSRIGILLYRERQAQVGCLLLSKQPGRVQIRAQIGQVLTGRVRWGIPYTPGTGNDISMAKEDEFILVDTDGIVGFNADLDKQRDGEALMVRDAEGETGASDLQ